MTKKVGLIIFVVIFVGIYFLQKQDKSVSRTNTQSVLSVSSEAPIDCFSGEVEVQEADTVSNSSSLMWWVNSGAKVNGSGGICSTVQGSLPANDKWRLLYAKNNPLDTDNGYHPQNLLRLIKVNLYKNVFQEINFKINKDNLSVSPNRNASNGVLFFMRYRDSDNLYYAGLRVDGTAVVKKKLAGKYTTLAQAKVFPGIYNRDSMPNLLPHDQWIGVRSEIVNLQTGGVLIRVYVDSNQSGVWQRLISVTDANNPILGYGYGGIRGDFMDLSFRNYIQRGYSL